MSFCSFFIILHEETVIFAEFPISKILEPVAVLLINDEYEIVPVTDDDDEGQQTHPTLHPHVLKEMLILEYVTLPLSFRINSLELRQEQIEESVKSFFVFVLSVQHM